MWICHIGTMDIPHMQCEPGLMKRQKRGSGGLSAQFSGIIIFSMDSYYRDITCSKCITKGFVIYPDNDIQA